MTVVFAWVLASAPAVRAATKTANVTLPATTKATFSMSGSVKRQGTLTNVAGVFVSASAFSVPVGTITSGYATTDTNGTWTIHGLVSGQYRVSYQPSSITGLLSSYWNGAGPNNNNLTTASAVTIGTANKTGVNTRLRWAQKISGTVTEIDGTTPIAGVTVSAGFSETVTDAAGAYTISGLAPGTHALKVQPSSEQPYQGGCYWTGAPLYKFSSNCVNKTTHHGRAGQDRHQHPPARRVHDHGLREEPLQRPDRGGVRGRGSADPDELDDGSSAETDATGKFVLKGLNPGAYRLFESAPFGSMYLAGWYLATDADQPVHACSRDQSTSNVSVSANVTLPGAIRPPTASASAARSPRQAARDCRAPA